MNLDNTEILLFLFVYKAIPIYIGVIWGIARYIAIRRDAIRGNIVYSKLMKAKILFSIIMAVQYIFLIIVSYIEDNIFFEQKEYLLLYLIYVLAWCGASILMVIEHRHDLPQVWHWHKLFWVLSSIFNFAFMTFLYALNATYDFVSLAFFVIEMIISLSLIAMMLKTKKRLAPVLSARRESSPMVERLIPSLKSGSMRIDVIYKLNTEEITFKVYTSKNNFEVKRKYSEFVEEEKRLSLFLKEQGMIEILQKIPRIEVDYAAESSDDITTVCTNRAIRIREFLESIWENPETWTRDMLKLMGIEGKSQEEFIRKRKVLIKDGEEAKYNISYDYSEQSMDLESSYINPSLKQIEEGDNEQSYISKNDEYKYKSTSSLLLLANKSSSGFIEYKASINQWRKSNEGNFIEYIIELTNFKGLEKKVTTKRYSDFVFIHELIMK